jgi:hypothetical protein
VGCFVKYFNSSSVACETPQEAVKPHDPRRLKKHDALYVTKPPGEGHRLQRVKLQLLNSSVGHCGWAHRSNPPVSNIPIG